MDGEFVFGFDGSITEIDWVVCAVLDAEGRLTLIEFEHDERHLRQPIRGKLVAGRMPRRPELFGFESEPSPLSDDSDTHVELNVTSGQARIEFDWANIAGLRLDRFRQILRDGGLLPKGEPGDARGANSDA